MGLSAGVDTVVRRVNIIAPAGNRTPVIQPVASASVKVALNNFRTKQYITYKNTFQAYYPVCISMCLTPNLGMDIRDEHQYKFCVKRFTHVKNYKHGDGAKL